jgi:cytolysin (calcineurin-like family phosphatase)
MTHSVLDRRNLLTIAATSSLTNLMPQLGQAQANEMEKIAFFVIGDTHFHAEQEQPGTMKTNSLAVCRSLVETMNQLPSQEIPAAAGGGRVLPPQGVIHAGDVIDSGDKQGKIFQQMQQTEWAAFIEEYGLTGSDGRLKFPVYEVHGNHDSPHGSGLAIEKIVERNQTRPGVTHRSNNGLHYSWDWGPAHFINLGLIVGNDRTIARKRRYAALDSLEFLLTDLRNKVGQSGRPVIITHHIDIARHTTGCDATAPADNKEWDPCDVQSFYSALQGYNIAAIFYGHTHARNVFRWNGQSTKATDGLAVFNTDNASHFSSDAQAIFYVELDHEQLLVREVQTKDRWLTHSFTPQTWSIKIANV